MQRLLCCCCDFNRFFFSSFDDFLYFFSLLNCEMRQKKRMQAKTCSWVHRQNRNGVVVRLQSRTMKNSLCPMLIPEKRVSKRQLMNSQFIHMFASPKSLQSKTAKQFIVSWLCFPSRLTHVARFFCYAFFCRLFCLFPSLNRGHWNGKLKNINRLSNESSLFS